MHYRRLVPDCDLAASIDCLWIVESDERRPVEQKIIPDGYPELIFHDADPYEINCTGSWQRQARNLIAGQINRCFHLRNTGRSGMIGIKLQPWAPASLFGLDMRVLADQVLDQQTLSCEPLQQLQHVLVQAPATRSGRIQSLCNGLRELAGKTAPDPAVVTAVRTILDTHGQLPIANLCARVGLEQRTLERRFLRQVGVSPKRYSRLIRFGTVFRRALNEPPDLSELSLDTGYYDQAHLHRDFRAFAGEGPARYPFRRRTIANFFLWRE